MKNKYIFFGMFFLTFGCGVKGKPLPPLGPTPIAGAEKSTKDSQKKKSSDIDMNTKKTENKGE